MRIRREIFCTAGTTLELQWDVTALAPKPSLSGDIATLDGRAIDDDGVVYVSGHGTLLLRPRHDVERA